MIKRVLVALFLMISTPAYAHHLVLDGTTGVVTIPYNTLYDDLPLEIYAIFKVDQLSTVKGDDQTIAELALSGGYTWRLYVSDIDNTIRFKTNSGTSVDIQSDSAISANKKYFVLVTIDSSRNVKMYIDEDSRDYATVASDLLQSDQATTAVLDTTGTLALYVGGSTENGNYLDGHLYEIYLANANVATFPVINLFDGVKVEDAIANNWTFHDGQGNLVWPINEAHIDTDSGIITGGYSWSLDTVTWRILEKENHIYWPGKINGVPWSKGIIRETEPYSEGDFSWADMHLMTHCEATKSDNLPYWVHDVDSCQNKCNREWHVSPSGNDTTGDGSEGNPWRTLGKMMESYALRPYYRDCFFIHAGTYFDNPGLYYSVDNLTAVEGSEENRIWIGNYGDGEVIIRGDITNELVWEAVDSNIYKTNYTYYASLDYPDDTSVANVILDDNSPHCCERMLSLDDIEKDGDWFWDKFESTTTGQATNKLIDSTANFGNETLPTEVGMWVKYYPSGVTQITNIDSPTQLTVSNNVFTTGNNYQIYKDLYVHTSGDHPFDDRNIIVTGSNNNITAGLHIGGIHHVTIFGLTLVGSESYSIWAFAESGNSKDVDIIRNTFKYTKGMSFGGPYWKVVQNRLHQGVSSNVGNGNFGNSGTQGGWPSCITSGPDGIMYGNIGTWCGGEMFGGQFSDNKRVFWNIAMNGWSVDYYTADSSRNLTLNNNVTFTHEFYPHWVAKDVPLTSSSGKARVWRRMVSDGILNGDEAAPRTKNFNISNNIIIGKKQCMSQFSSCGLNEAGVTACANGTELYPNEDPSGWKYIDFTNNVCISPSINPKTMGAEWLGMNVNHQGGPDNDYSIGSRTSNNVFIMPGRGAYHLWWWSNTPNVESKFHEVNNNYYFAANRHPLQWKAVKYGFDDWKAQSGHDADGSMGEIDDDGNITPQIFERTNFSLEGEVIFDHDDFIPSSGSTLIDGGSTFDVTGTFSRHDFRDLDGKPRPLGPGWDIGIYEYGTWYRKSIGNGTISGGSF